MRTTLNLPDDLIEEAKEAFGVKSKTEAIIFSLKEAIRRKRIEELKSLAGKIHFDLDIDEFRERSRRRRNRK